jgi:hypothetical protein
VSEMRSGPFYIIIIPICSLIPGTLSNTELPFTTGCRANFQERSPLAQPRRREKVKSECFYIFRLFAYFMLSNVAPVRKMLAGGRSGACAWEPALRSGVVRAASTS